MDHYGSPETADAPRKKRRGWIFLIIIAVLLVMIVPIGLVFMFLVFRHSERAHRYERARAVAVLRPSPHTVSVGISPWGKNQTAKERLKLTLRMVEVRLVKRAEVPPKLVGSLGPGKELLAIKLKLANASQGRIMDHAKMDRLKLWDNFGNRMRTAPGRIGTGEIKPGNAVEFTVWAVPPRVDNATHFRGSLGARAQIGESTLMKDLEFRFKSSDIQDKQGGNP